MKTLNPLLLLPGLMNDKRVWAPLTSAIGAERHTLVAPTHLHATAEESARDAIASMPPGRFAVAGFSLGGYVAMEVCRQAPERIAGLALLSTGARSDTDDAKQARMRMVEAMGNGVASFDQIAAGFAARIVHPDHLQNIELLGLLADMAKTVGSEGFVKQQKAAMTRADSSALLCRIDAPALVLCGREDLITPLASSEEMASLLPNAELVIVERAGHMTTLEQPGMVVQALVRWLSRVDRGSEVAGGN